MGSGSLSTGRKSWQHRNSSQGCARGSVYKLKCAKKEKSHACARDGVGFAGPPPNPWSCRFLSVENYELKSQIGKRATVFSEIARAICWVFFTCLWTARVSSWCWNITGTDRWVNPTHLRLFGRLFHRGRQTAIQQPQLKMVLKNINSRVVWEFCVPNLCVWCFAQWNLNLIFHSFCSKKRQSENNMHVFTILLVYNTVYVWFVTHFDDVSTLLTFVSNLKHTTNWQILLITTSPPPSGITKLPPAQNLRSCEILSCTWTVIHKKRETVGGAANSLALTSSARCTWWGEWRSMT